MKKLAAFVLLCRLLSSCALADCLYAIQPAQPNMKALKDAAFSSRAQDAAEEQRDYGRVFYSLPDRNGPPFCGAGPDSELMQYYQSRISVVPEVEDRELHQFSMMENLFSQSELSVTGGIAREHVMSIAQNWMNRLDMMDARMLSIATYGRIESLKLDYKITFLQTLNGLPIYWGDMLDDGRQPESNLAYVVLDGESGSLVELSAFWSRFTPLGEDTAEISRDEAAQAFTSLGLDAEAMERCYWMTPASGPDARAYPAYRVHNTFLNALTGEWLQLETHPLETYP